VCKTGQARAHILLVYHCMRALLRVVVGPGRARTHINLPASLAAYPHKPAPKTNHKTADKAPKHAKRRPLPQKSKITVPKPDTKPQKTNTLTNQKQTRQKWANVHEAPILDLSWRDDTSFATGSADKTIKLFDLAQPERPRQTFRVRCGGGWGDGGLSGYSSSLLRRG